MPKLRRLSGAEVIAILGRFGFTVHSQRGSHVKLRRVLVDGTVQTLTIPHIQSWIRGHVEQSFVKRLDSCRTMISAFTFTLTSASRLSVVDSFEPPD